MSLLKDLWMQEGYTFDSQFDILYGEKNGYKFVVQDYGQKRYSLMFSVKKEQQGVIDILDTKMIQGASKAVGNVSFKNHKVTAIIKAGFTKKKTKENILLAIEQLSSFFAQNSFVQACELTGDTEEVDLYIMGNQLSFLSPTSFRTLSQEIDSSEQMMLQTKENILGGTVGALLGSLLGVAAIVIIGQMGYVSSLGGIIMGVGTLKGYELLAKKLSKKGVIISIIVILLMTYFANQLDWAFAVSSVYEVSVFEVFPHINDLVAENYIDSSIYIENLLKLFGFTIIISVVMIYNVMKEKKNQFVVSKLI